MPECEGRSVESSSKEGNCYTEKIRIHYLLSIDEKLTGFALLVIFSEPSCPCIKMDERIDLPSNLFIVDLHLLHRNIVTPPLKRLSLCVSPILVPQLSHLIISPPFQGVSSRFHLSERVKLHEDQSSRRGFILARDIPGAASEKANVKCCFSNIRLAWKSDCSTAITFQPHISLK